MSKEYATSLHGSQVEFDRARKELITKADKYLIARNRLIKPSFRRAIGLDRLNAFRLEVDLKRKAKEFEAAADDLEVARDAEDLHLYGLFDRKLITGTIRGLDARIEVEVIEDNYFFPEDSPPKINGVPARIEGATQFCRRYLPYLEKRNKVREKERERLEAEERKKPLPQE